MWSGLGKTPGEPGFLRVNPVNFSKTGIPGVPGENYIVYYDERTSLSHPPTPKNFSRVIPGYPALLPGEFTFLKNKFAEPCT